jgi:hypothetical protein
MSSGRTRFIAKRSAMVPKLRPAIILAGCGHWTEQERAPEVSAAMIDFLRSLLARTRTKRFKKSPSPVE